MSPTESDPKPRPTTKTQPSVQASNNNRPKLIIDADAGIGDALAIITALLDPQVDLQALTATAGVVTGQQANYNLQTIVNRLDPDKYPRIGHAEEHATARIMEFNQVPTPLLIGETGLGDCPVSPVSLASPHHSAKLMAELVRTNPHQITLLTLGPLTNVKLACELHPNFMEELKSLICLGGTISQSGDITSAAEGNIYADSEAARAVLNSPAEKILVPLDISRKLRLTFAELDRLPKEDDSELSTLIDQLVSFALRSARQHLAQEGIELREIVALAAVTRPQLFSRRLMTVDVETTGTLTQGMTVFDRRRIPGEKTNVEVVTDLDVNAIMDYFTGVLWSA